MGKLIVIEGLDGSGKSTQLDLLYENLKKKGIDCKSVSFPDYDNPSSTLVKMYLKGDFGKKPSDVNAFAASVFYTVDRYASFKANWGSYYENGGTVVAGRYTTSNAVHQASKLPENEWESFLNWLYDFEYNKIGIPKPDKVIFLDMPTEVSQKLLTKRYEGDDTKKDIHESDVEYLEKCRKAAVFTANFSGWETISCAKDGEARTIEDIAGDVLNSVLKIYEQSEIMIYVFLADGFEECEAIAPIDILRRAQIEVSIVGIGSKSVTGSHGITVECDIEENQAVFENLNGIILPGGMPGTLNLENNSTVQKFIDFAEKNNLLIAAICAAPSILGHKNLLNGKKATCFTGFEKELLGANVLNEPVVCDQNFITAYGAGAALDFGFQIVSAIKGNDFAEDLKKQMRYSK